MCLLLLVFLVPLLLVFAVPFFAAVFGINIAVTAFDKKKHGEEADPKLREIRVARQVAVASLASLGLFLGLLLLRYSLT